MTSTARVDLVTPEATWRALRDGAGLVLLCTALVAGVALGISLTRSKRYSSTATLLVRTPVIPPADGGRATPALDPGREAETDQRLMSLPVIAERTARALGVSASAVTHDIRVSSEGTSYLYSLSATASTAVLSAQLVNAYAQQFVAFREGLDRARLDAVLALVRARIHASALLTSTEALARLASGQAVVVQPAEVSRSPSSPRTGRDTVVGGIVGFLIGVGLVLAVRIMRRPTT